MLPGKLRAQTLHLPLAIQLYSVRELLPNDYAGTLKQLGALGYREVESAGYFNRSTTEVKQAMDAAGLKLVSAHYPSNDLHKQFDQIIEPGGTAGKLLHRPLDDEAAMGAIFARSRQ